MRRSRSFACLAVVAAISGCGQAGRTTSSHVTSGQPCHVTTDSVTPTLIPLIQEQPPSATAPQAVTTPKPLACGTRVGVAMSGSAKLRFGGGAEATCQLMRYQPAHEQEASLLTRDQPNDLFTLYSGTVLCTWSSSSNHPTVHLCGGGSLLTNGHPQGTATCDTEPFFQVAVFSGSIRVIYPNGQSQLLHPMQMVRFNLRTQQATPVTAAVFSAADIALFTEQSLEMHITTTPATQTINFTSVPPTNPTPKERYVVTATGGGSGNPVTFTIDPSSGNSCSISGHIVTFLGAGTCTIDANQAGNAQYQAAPQAQQSITVS